VRQVVERHGGRVGVTSPASGASNEFFFTLPA
jgi:signal transduction histidine kinase